jgi:tetratricopeptide (TPR) repeat protein
MNSMKKICLLALAAALLAGNGRAEEFPSEPYDFVLAKLAASEGRVDEALVLIERVIEKNPNDPILLFERALMLLDAGKIDRGEAELRRLTASHPDFYDAQKILGRVLIDRAGNDRVKLEAALTHLQAAFKINPDDLAVGLTLSQLLVAIGKTADAERVLAAMVERSPDQRVVNYQYAQVLTKLGRGDESKQYLEKAVLLDPMFAPAVMELTDIYQKEGEWQKAADALQPLVENDPINVELRRRQAYFFLRAGVPEKAREMFRALADADPNDARSLFYLAESLSDLEQYDDAEKIYRRLLERAPNDAELLASFGLTLIGQRKLEDAETTFKSILKLPELPDNVRALSQTQLALVQLQKGNYDAAVATAGAVFIFRDNPNTQAVGIALEALRKQKRYDQAVALLEPLVARFGTDPFINARHVEMLQRAGETEKARAAAAGQIKLGTRNVIATAEAYIQSDEPKIAIELVKEALRTKPEEIDLLFELGSAYERSGDHDSAEKAFLQVLQKIPDHAATLNYLGYMWADNNRNLDRAAVMLNRAVEQEPRNGAYVDSLGWLYYRQGKLDLAEKYLSDAARLLPRDATVHEHLGDVLARQGKTDRALEAYRIALTLEPEPKDEAKLRSKIAEVERQAQR